jgi:hypothetical protein
MQDAPTHPVIVTILNFIRGTEPRDSSIDLFDTFAQESQALVERDLPATILLQHDALIEPRYAEFIRENLSGGRHEIGAWLEVPQSLVEKAGLPWRGRFGWDWHCNVGFTIGYTPEERMRLIDAYMRDFSDIFGRCPRSVGSWFLDAFSLSYLRDEYGIVASCNCKDQWGTDGYSLWGGYWNQAYYPSRNNSFLPAQTKENQIDVPVFRMLGSDMLYQYEAPIQNGNQDVITLEPVYTKGGGGGHPAWVRWFFRQIMENPALSFAYAQVGQENSFGWPKIQDGYIDQVEYLSELSQAGRIRLETLSESGEWFRRTYPLTPAAATIALEDWRGASRTSIWYNSRYYRANLFTEGPLWRLRDIRVFDERYAERYLDTKTDDAKCMYDTPPVMDGLLWSRGEDRAGIFLQDQAGGTLALAGKPKVEQLDDTTLRVSATLENGVELVTTFYEKKIEFSVSRGADWRLRFRWPKPPPDVRVGKDFLDYLHEGRPYSARFSNAALHPCDGGAVLVPTGNNAVFMSFRDAGESPRTNRSLS